MPSTVRTRPATRLRAFAGGWLALVVLVALAVVGCGKPPVIQARAAFEPTALPTPAPTQDDVPEVELDSVEDVAEFVPGVTEDTIRVAMLSDASPEGEASDVFISARRGVEAWAKAVNARGGLADRKIELVLFDAAVSNHEDRLREICGGDFFAMVGSLSYHDDVGVQVIDSSWCRMPDFPTAAMNPQARASQVTYLSDPFLNTEYDVAALRERLLSSPASVKLSSNIQFVTPPFLAESVRMREAASSLGYDFESFLSSVNPGTDMTVQAEQLVKSPARSLVWTGSPGDLAELLRAVDDIELGALDFAICTFGCYDPGFTDAVGSVSTPVYVSIPHLPFAEQDLSSQLREYMLWLGQGGDSDALTQSDPAEQSDVASDTDQDDAASDTEQEDAASDAGEQDDAASDSGEQDDAASDTGEHEDSEPIVAEDRTDEPTDGPTEEPVVLNAFGLPDTGGPQPSSQGFAAWVAGRLFEQAVNEAVRFGTNDYDPALLTRDNVLAAASNIQSWDARGAYGEASPASRIPSSCMVIVALIDGEWSRAFPTLRGTWDCSTENIAVLAVTASYGLESEATSSNKVLSDDDSVPAEELPTPTPAAADPLEAPEEPAG